MGGNNERDVIEVRKVAVTDIANKQCTEVQYTTIFTDLAGV